MKFVVQARASKDWSKTKGTVVNTRVRSSRDTHNSSSSFYPEIEYSYTVDGESYTSTRFRLGDGSNATGYDSTKSAREIAALWKSGDPIEVLYDPEAPSSAVLTSEISWGVYVPSILGTFFGAIGLLLLAVVLREPKTG